ncbi:MAG: HEAT repeat protein [Planctomycetota bacterium]|jgi:HEAT repeat protein
MLGFRVKSKNGSGLCEFSPMRHHFILLVLISLCCGLSAQDSRDEVHDFFGQTRSKPSQKQNDEIRALWRKAQIGARQDRLDARVELLEFGELATSILEENLGAGSLADVRTSALILSRSGDHGVTLKIRKLLFESDKTVVARRHLTLALGLLGNAEDAIRLSHFLKKDRRNDFRRAVVLALGQLQARQAVPTLVGQFQKDNSQAFRRCVLLALGAIGGDETMALIRKSLKSSKESVRRSATLAAANLRTVDLLPEFRRLLKDSDDTVVRYTLIGLGLLRDPGVALAIKKSGILRTGKADQRALAVTALSMQSDAVSLQLLKNRGKSKLERSDEVRLALAFALNRRPKAMTTISRKRLYADREPKTGQALWCSTALRPQKTSGLLLEKAIFNRALHDHVRLTLLDLIAYHDPEHADLVFRKILDERRFKKPILVRSAELQGILQRTDEFRRRHMQARIQVEVDDLGGSPEWNLLKAYHQEFLGIENILRPLTRPGGGTKPGGQQAQRPDPWTNEDEDLRLWFDRYPYLDRRAALDVYL